MESLENLKMSSLFKDRDRNSPFLESEFDEKSSLVVGHVGNEIDISSVTSTLDSDRSLYMENTVTWQSAIIHIIKGNLGLGILGLPLAMMNAGIVVGPVLIVLTGIVVVHCMHLMVQTSHLFCDRSQHMSLGYAKVAEMAVGLYNPNKKRLGSLIVNTFLVVTQLGFCCIYIIFVADTLQQILIKYVYLDIKVWVTIILLPIILLSYIRTLKFMSVLSAIANVLYIAGIICLLVHAGKTAHNPDTLPKFVGFGTLPLALGTIVFAYESIGVILPVENVMAKPRNFYYLLNGAMFIVMVITVLFGTMGYMSCGHHCLGSFTLNLPNTMFGETVKLMFAIAIFFTYFLQFYVPMEIIIPSLHEKTAAKYHTLVDLGFRTLMVCLTAILAVGIPQLGNMISLFGSLGSVSLAITFPASLHLATLHHDRSLSIISYVKDIFIISFGVLATIAGFYESLVTIIWTFQHPDKQMNYYGPTVNSTSVL